MVLICNKYRENVPIILKQDSGFYDQRNFKAFEELGIDYVCGGKIYADIREYVENCLKEQWVNIEKKESEMGKIRVW